MSNFHSFHQKLKSDDIVQVVGVVGVGWELGY